MPKLSTITDFVDDLMKIDEFEDGSNNGLQVQNSGQVKRVCLGVDASLPMIKETIRRKADLLVCHHGISWNDHPRRLVDIDYERVADYLPVAIETAREILR